MIEIRVIGTPAPQGSKRHLGHGVMIESSKKVKPWREAVVYAAHEILEARFKNLDAIPVSERGRLMNSGGTNGPVTVDIRFYFDKPKSAKKRQYHSTKPDIDKLVRSTFDALKTAGAIEDDSRVVGCTVMKLFTDSAHALEGADIKICPLP